MNQHDPSAVNGLSLFVPAERRHSVIACVAIAIVLGCLYCTMSAHASQPNILWITAEDMSPTLGCWGDDYATTPHLDQLAQQSVRYTNAFATAPVCSPSRSCLITGCYANSLGTHQMRSALPIPDFMEGFPAFLRAAGYYTTNNVKTDYNTSSADRIIGASWNESSETAHWRKRTNKSQPFFSVFNIMTSHQSRSMVWSQGKFRADVQSKLSPGEIHNPHHAPVPPYYPDNLVTRRIVARYYDCVTAMDKRVGEILKQLADDGHDEDTIVFFYSDHGSGMPRHKRLLHDSGMHVPLLIRFPNRFGDLAPRRRGTTVDQLVSFVDFPPTVLSLAGITPPEYMQGLPFLGKKSQKRTYVYGHRDRIDEVIDLGRSVRDQRYLYIRNFIPHLSHNQFSAYSDLSEIRHEIYRMAESGVMSDTQSHYASPTKPKEELYDCLKDPENTSNLIGSLPHAATLERMRTELSDHLRRIHDVGFIPESYARTLFAGTTQWEKARSEVFTDHQQALLACDGLLKQPEMAHALLQSDRPSTRYWGAIGLAGTESLPVLSRQALLTTLQDDVAAVRIEAAHTLGRHGHVEEALPVLIEALKASDLNVVLHATRTIELLGKAAKAAEPQMRAVAERAAKLQAADTPAVFVQTDEQDLAMFCSFSANGFLQRIRQGNWRELIQDQQQDDWSNRTDNVHFVGDAEITMTSKGRNLWIVHKDEFENFELTAEAIMPAEEYNAGIGFRIQLQQNGRLTGYQCEIADDESGRLYVIGSGGWVGPKSDQQRQQFFDQVGSAFRREHWNHFRIRCEGEHVQIWVNGILTTDVLDDKHSTGRIALQHHGKGGVHHYRNLRIRTLD